jgi:ATP synthase protein I
MVQGNVPEGNGSGPTSSHDGGAAGYLLAGILLFGGLGLLLDRTLGTSWLTPLGLVVGALAGGYLVYVRVVRDTGTAPANRVGRSGPDERDQEERR